MKKLAFLLPFLILVCLLSGCTKDEVPPPESEDTTLKAATVDQKITITKILPNGKEITIEVPAEAVEQIIDQTPKLPYSPEGVYIFQLLEKPFPKFDVFITSFDGTDFIGTFGYPAGENYTLTGQVVSKEHIEYHPLGYNIFTGAFVVNDQKRYVFDLGTSESDGIIKDWRSPYPDPDPNGENQLIVLRTIPYSPEGHYVICELAGIDIVRVIEFCVTSFDENNFKGKYAYTEIKGTDEFTGELEGYVRMKGEIGVYTMDLHLLREGGIDVIWTTIEGEVDIEEGMTTFSSPWRFLPVQEEI